jgi:hypothetical protein
VKGRLVRLSKYGVMIKCLSRYINRVGVIIDEAPPGLPQHYEVFWTGDTRSVYNHMREIKRAK